MSQTASPVFRLLDLPPELFLHICRYAIPGGNTHIVSNSGKKRPVLQPPITRVCQLLREELLPVFYTRNIFNYHDRPKAQAVNRLTGFLRSVPLACKKEDMRVFVISQNKDTQTFLKGPLQFIGYSLEKCDAVDVQTCLTMARGTGRPAEDDASWNQFRVVRRS
ncbi:hypothetical protein LTR17_024432 [Elasticomyces elasticus]|nr:hypothetical protein LTR17_024432 [Elasticomyces elasticus]